MEDQLSVTVLGIIMFFVYVSKAGSQHAPSRGDRRRANSRY